MLIIINDKTLGGNLMNRKKSREIAMKLLFQTSMNQEEVQETIDGFLDNHEDNHEDIDIDYVKRVLVGVKENLSEIDKCIEQYLINWKMNRISKINLSILRICTYEVMFEADIPGKVSVNEAIELAKKYSEETSFAFVNGVLDKIIKNADKQ
jgi:N utilization substance protein B